MALPLPPPPPVNVPLPLPAKKKDFSKTPQELVSEFWDKFFAKKPGKVTSIFPRSLYDSLLPPTSPRGSNSAKNAAESYEAAAKECREKVKRIIRECRRTNEKFTDPDFDIESDFDKNCLNGLIRDPPVDLSFLFGGDQQQQQQQALDQTHNHQLGGKDDGRGKKKHGTARTTTRRSGVMGGETYSPGSIHRIDWIFEKPQFTVDGFSSSDIKQGANGDCWWLAAVATIAHRRDLMNKACVIRDEEVGVYGFVFYRDGEWISTVVDDNLFLTHEDFDFYGDTYDATGKRAREHRKRHQTGSEALYFAKCEDPNETWLPLLEKAYAKVHGDYESISGGYPGEAVEDMTGGVSTTVATNRVLDKNKLWRELANSDGEFVFALSALGTGWDRQKGGLALGHAYSVLKATEEVDEDGNRVRLVKIRNPWGERAWDGIGEWNGPWSDGSKEWTPYWLKKLNHTFGDDGIFWMSYRDMLDTFMFLHRTRLFDEKWTVVQQWTSVNVGWVAGYLNTKFIVDVKKAGTVVIVLAQLDERFFLGFQGQYEFALHFLLQEENGTEHICRVRPVHAWENRSVSCEVDLEPGRYEVLPKITATRDPQGDMVEDVVRDWADKNPAKLRQVGMQYDLAHAKGGIPDEDEILIKKKEEEKKKKEEKKRKQKEKARRQKQKQKLEIMVTVDTDDGSIATKTEDNTKDKSQDEKKDEEEKFEDAVEAKMDEAEKKEEKKEEAKHETKEDEKKEKKKDDKPATGNVPGDKPGKEKEKEKEKEEEKDTEKKDDEDEDEEESEDEEEKKDDSPPLDGDDDRTPWNAVCVIGLRVYARDPDVTIALAKPKSEEEAASLVVDSKAVGATM